MRQKHHIHTGNHTADTLAQLNRASPRVACHQRCRASRVIRHARTLEPQDVGYPTRSDRMSTPRGSVDATPRSGCLE
eukprot:scaffold329295_cov97-Tisochrysis_lutea.AAC.1